MTIFKVELRGAECVGGDLAAAADVHGFELAGVERTSRAARPSGVGARSSGALAGVRWSVEGLGEGFAGDAASVGALAFGCLAPDLSGGDAVGLEAGG